MARGVKTGGRDFRKGQGGRPKGVPNRATREVRELARSIVEDPGYLEGLKKRVEAGQAPHMETLLFHYAYGKPKERIEHSGEGSRVQLVFNCERPPWAPAQ